MTDKERRAKLDDIKQRRQAGDVVWLLSEVGRLETENEDLEQANKAWEKINDMFVARQAKALELLHQMSLEGHLLRLPEIIGILEGREQ